MRLNKPCFFPTFFPDFHFVLFRFLISLLQCDQIDFDIQPKSHHKKHTYWSPKYAEFLRAITGYTVKLRTSSQGRPLVFRADFRPVQGAQATLGGRPCWIIYRRVWLCLSLWRLQTTRSNRQLTWRLRYRNKTTKRLARISHLNFEIQFKVEYLRRQWEYQWKDSIHRVLEMEPRIWKVSKINHVQILSGL